MIVGETHLRVRYMLDIVSMLITPGRITKYHVFAVMPQLFPQPIYQLLEIFDVDAARDPSAWYP